MAHALAPETLLTDAAWLRRLATSLAGDADDADDVAQEAWIAAWRRQPDADRPVRPWLAKVARDLVRMRRRGDGRRRARELALDDGREVTPPDVLLERVQLQRRLVELVLALDEPLRGTLIARFVDGQSCAAIARANDLPEGTVRWRLHTALARLRAQLDATSDRRAWAPLLLGFAQKGLHVTRPTRTALVVVALLVLLIAVGVLIVGRTRDGATAATPHAARASTPAPLARDVAPPPARNVAPPPWRVQPELAPRRIAGRVLVDGAPAAGATVRLVSDPPVAGAAAPERTTGVDGSFDFGPHPAARYAIGAVLAARVATVRRVDLRDPLVRADAVVLALDPCVVGLSGAVLDPSGAPIAGAELLAQGVIGTEADAAGRFELCLPAQGSADQLQLVVRAAGYGAIELALVLPGRLRHDFTLSPEAVVFGRVVDPRGAAVAGAELRIDWDEATPRPASEHPASVRVVSDGYGRFQIAGLAAGRHRITGFARALAAEPQTVELIAGDSHEQLVQLTARATVRGRVVQAGQPIAGVTVSDRAERPTYQRTGVAGATIEAVSQADGSFVLDGLPVGDVELATAPHRLRAPTTARLIAGEQALTLEVEAAAEITGTVTRHGVGVAHGLVRAAPEDRWLAGMQVTADEAGRFALRGLDAGAYALFAHSGTAGAITLPATPVTVHAGEHRTIDLALAGGGRIAGTVEEADRTPVAGAVVRLYDAARDDGAACVTDAAGRFECATMIGGSYGALVFAAIASPAPYRFAGAAPAPIALADGDARVDGVRLVVVREHRAIRGVVVDDADAPVADARVTLVTDGAGWQPAQSTISATDGSFALTDLASGRYRVQVVAASGISAQRAVEVAGADVDDVRVTVASLACAPGPLGPGGGVALEEPLGLTHPRERIVWDGRVELVGWDVAARAHVGDTVTLTFAFRVLRPLERSWKIFVHVDGPQRRINGDHDPLGGRCPAAHWRPGDLLIDRLEIIVDDAEPPGAYAVWMGFFAGQAPTWKNLPVSLAPADARDAHERVKAATLVVEP